MLPYVESFQLEDRERLFGFLTLFVRWECALKHTGFVRQGRHGQTEPDWKKFATTYEAAVAALNDHAFTSARAILLAKPPKQEQYNGHQVRWRPNPRRPNESDATYLCFASSGTSATISSMVASSREVPNQNLRATDSE